MTKNGFYEQRGTYGQLHHVLGDPLQAEMLRTEYTFEVFTLWDIFKPMGIRHLVYDELSRACNARLYKV